MPRQNGTGSMGQGAMTGRAQGRCTGAVLPGEAPPVPGRGNAMGCGFRGGRRGWRLAQNTVGQPRGMRFWRNAPTNPNQDPGSEKQDLMLQVKALEAQLADIRQRLDAIEPGSATR